MWQVVTRAVGFAKTGVGAGKGTGASEKFDIIVHLKRDLIATGGTLDGGAQLQRWQLLIIQIYQSVQIRRLIPKLGCIILQIYKYLCTEVREQV